MVNTRQSGTNEPPVQLKDSGKIEAEPQSNIVGSSNAAGAPPLSSANDELEQQIAGTYAKERQELDSAGGAEFDKADDRRASGLNTDAEYQSPQGGDAMDDESGLDGTVPASQAMAEMGEDMGEVSDEA